MAIASKQLAATYNRDGYNLVDNKIWCFTGDGCLQEGVGQEGELDRVDLRHSPNLQPFPLPVTSVSTTLS
jgi:hypothetical protein